MRNTTTRRTFLKQAGTAGLGITIGGLSFDAKSYARITGANERINVAVMGTNGRGNGMARNFQTVNDVDVTFVCDVE